MNYHGTSTVLNDAVESRCVRQLCRTAGQSRPRVVDQVDDRTPSGASGAAGIVTESLALRYGYLPPTINQVNPDPACDLDFIPNVGRAVEVSAALCNCLGFGSKNSAMVLGSAGVRRPVG